MRQRKPGFFSILCICMALAAVAWIPSTKTDSGSVAQVTSDSTSSIYHNHIFDTFYTCNNRHYTLRLLTFADREDEMKSNSVFTINQITAAGNKAVLEDSLYSFTGEIEFRDFNGDQVNDILVQHTSDVRSNHTSYLYLADAAGGGFKRIKGFETIKQPRYIPEYDLVDNYVVSGNNWTSFYKIVGDTIRDYGIVLYERRKSGRAGTV